MKVFVDTDTLLYSAAAVTEARTINVLHEPSGISKEFTTRTELKKSLKEKGKELTPDYVITDVQTPEPVENCLHLVKSQVENILTKFDFCDVVFVAGDKNNFRRNLPLPYRYKSQRESTLRPVHLKEAHTYLKKQYNSVSPDGWEADDHVVLLASEAAEQGHDSVILSADKDNRQSIGISIGGYSDEPSDLVKINSMHEVSLVDKHFKSYGVPWIAYQMLVGDVSDFYKPTDLCSAKYGDVSCYKDLLGCQTEQGVLLKVIQKYKQWYPDKFEYTAWDSEVHEADWKSMLELYFKCAKMKTSKNDRLIAGEFFAKYRVEL